MSWLRNDIAHWSLFDFGAWHAFEKSTDQLVGRIGSHVTVVEGTMEVELAWAIHADHWGQGYAAELAIPARDLVFSRGTLVYDRGEILTQPGHGRSSSGAGRRGNVRRGSVVDRCDGP